MSTFSTPYFLAQKIVKQLCLFCSKLWHLIFERKRKKKQGEIIDEKKGIVTGGLFFLSEIFSFNGVQVTSSVHFQRRKLYKDIFFGAKTFDHCFEFKNSQILFN